MPLKHPTETLLIFFLGLATIVTGILLSTLPPLPPGILPWLIVFVLTLAYPAGLYPLLKNNRADYEFRLLHFVPALMSLLWLLLNVLGMRASWAQVAEKIFLFAWALPFVTVVFLLLVLFCLHVIRRWLPRLLLLALLFIPYVAVSLSSEAKFKGTEQIASVLWQGSWWNITGTSPQTLEAGSSGKNLAYSSYPDEEKWREKLRQFEGTGIVVTSTSSPSSSSIRSSSVSSGIVASSFSSLPSSSSVSSILSSFSSSAAPVPASIFSEGSSSSKPPSLPSSGPEDVAVLALSLGGLYFGALHARAKKRSRAGA